MSSIKWLLPQTPVTESDLSRFTNVFGRILPNDFKEWVLKHNGACPEPAEIKVGADLSISINSFVSFSEIDSPNVFSTLSMLKHRIQDDMLPIADDPGGNYIALRYSKSEKNPDVVFWDHEESEAALAVKPIAKSFSEFIRLLSGGQ